MPRFLQNAETDWLPFSSRSRKIVKYLLRSACSDFFMRMSFRYDVISFTKINPPIHRSPWGYRYLEKLQQDVVILREQPNEGRTIIEKFEDYAEVGFAVVLLTADDRGAASNVLYDAQKPRARQN